MKQKYEIMASGHYHHSLGEYEAETSAEAMEMAKERIAFVWGQVVTGGVEMGEIDHIEAFDVTEEIKASA